MMIRFSGRSSETHQIKNKPIGEDYKFFALTTSQGFFASFTPDGRTTSESGRSESSENRIDGKIEPMILFVTSVIGTFCETQKERLNRTSTRATDNERQADFDIDNFCMAMDNYFTLPQATKRLREKGIGVVGMAKMRKGWPHPALKKTKQNKCDFNNFRYLVDDNGTIVAQ
eukprot:15365994-Ditylum_brightwellii.AAC.1